MKKYLIAFLPFVFLLLIVFMMRDKGTNDIEIGDKDFDTLVIVTPHTDQIKYEFAEAFKDYYFKKHNRKVKFDYRTLGGTSDIVRYIYDQYESNFRHYYEKELGKSWSDEIAQNFANINVSKKNVSAVQARKDFLNSDVSIGIDLFWGGGTFDHNRQAQQGFAVDGKVKERHPEYFVEEILPFSYAGEKIYDEQGRYYGICLSSFGVCFNGDRVAEIGENFVINDWKQLGDTRLFNQCIIADPSKSGSVNKCFESIIQQSMSDAVAQYGEKSGVAIGWSNGLNLIKRIVGNSRYIADSAGKVTREIAKGNGTGGIAIDFYALSESEYSSAMSKSKKPTIFYQAPISGAPISADPIQLLRGSPNRKVAEEFIDFLLSVDGQKLWNFRLGTPGGPRKYALRRPPIRKDMYEERHHKYFADKDYNPYKTAENIVYRGDWTGRYFNLIRTLIRCTMLDVEAELKLAWGAIIEAGGPEKVPQAMSYFNRDIVSYGQCPMAAKSLYPSENNTMLDIVQLRKRWSMEAMENFKKAYELAKKGL